MSPKSLLFSSDQETSRRLTQTLQELELEVEHCTEIFQAVERLTSQSFEVIVADWDDGVEASFLIKTSRELKANRDAFAMAIVSDAHSVAAAQQVAALVLKKPIVSDRAKYALLTCDEFLRCMRNWLPKLSVSGGPTHAPQPRPVAKISPRPAGGQNAATRRSSALGQRSDPGNPLWPDRTRPARLRRASQNHSSGLLLLASIGVTFLSVGYVFSQPLRKEISRSSVAGIYQRAVEKTHDWLRRPADSEAEASSEFALNMAPLAVRPTTHIRVRSARGYTQPGPAPSAVVEPPSVEAGPEQPQSTASAVGVQIPESLRVPIEMATIRNVAARITPSLLGALEPVSLPEDLAERLLLQKVQPGYPEMALRTGLQGPVVLQAWIARDGTIRDLKLIRGSLILGKAAYQAVKQWRYKPYLLNGQAVEAQTFVTVDFKLPQESFAR